MDLNYGVAAKKIFLLSLLLVLNYAIPNVYGRESRVQVIANPSVDVTTLDKDQVRRIFSMYQTNWPNSQPIAVFVLANQNSTHQLFSREILGVFPYQLERLWHKLVYSGLGDGPFRVNSEQEMLEKIKQQPGSIGYLQTIDTPTGVTIITLTGE